MGTLNSNGRSNGHGGSNGSSHVGLLPKTDELVQAINVEIRKAIRRHKLLGNPICVGDPDGTVRWIQPEDIELEDE